MRSANIFASALAFAASAFAQTPGFAVISAPTEADQVPSGTTKVISWAPGSATGKVTISLLGGESPSTLQVLGDLSTGVDVAAGSFSWAVDCALGTAKTYGIKIASEADPATFQYSFPFGITGPSCGATVASSSSSSSTVEREATGGYPTAGYPVESASVPAYPTGGVPATSESVSSTEPVAPVGYPTAPASSSVPVYPTAGISTTAVTSAVTTPATTPATTPSYPTGFNTTVTPSYPTAGPSGNLTYTTSAPTTLVPSTVGYPTASTTATPTAIPTAAAVKTGGSLALVAGIAFAVLAL